MLIDWEEDLMVRLGRVDTLTDLDRDYCVRVLQAAMVRVEREEIAKRMAEEVHWPLPRPAVEGPQGQGVWLSRWLARKVR